MSEALKNLTGLTTACMIQDVRNDKVSKIFIDAYKNRRATNFWGGGGGSPDHLESARIQIVFKKKYF